MATLAPTAAPDDWFGWLRANRQHVAVVLDDGRGGRVAHRPHERQPLASVRVVAHLAKYAEGVVEPDERVRVADWEQYRVGHDGGAHSASLRELGLACSNGVTADDPRRFVTVGELVAVMVRHGDGAAGDWLRGRLGVAVPAFSTEVLRLVLGRSVEVERYVRDPRLRLEVLGKSADVTHEGRRSWARGTWAGTAAEVNRACRALAGVLIEGTGLPGIVTVACSVRWDDGRVGSAAVLTREVDEAWHARAGELVRLVRTALAEPAVLREFHVSLS
ncbi:hypothetical protein ADK67_30590 [Saccharothrix sp. NRRL B-16348]|uniref:hypothetical protein n=1 Tax=Saccharothrix sp. NRRL B-16348 TaxID=1415542 RepID=UPI0006AFF405|nr:hypothetical protein [Saccharothrix sp. NRRL B-16348]KOX20221.1 hypothetical protein ADK67_30590 [Saccharothrix sp. NRRL B-16348]